MGTALSTSLSGLSFVSWDSKHRKKGRLFNLMYSDRNVSVCIKYIYISPASKCSMQGYHVATSSKEKFRFLGVFSVLMELSKEQLSKEPTFQLEGVIVGGFFLISKKKKNPSCSYSSLQRFPCK